MDYTIERFVKVYVHNTARWRRAGFEGQTVYLHVLRATDRAGKFPISSCCVSAAEDISGQLDIPLDFAERGLARALDVQLLVQADGFLIDPTFVEAQFWDNRRRPIPDHVRAEVLELHGMVCWLCESAIESASDLHLDHVRPKSRGGSDEVGNLRPAHSRCNIRRGNKSVASFKTRLAKEALS